MVIATFFISIFLILYLYLGYPLLVLIISMIKPKHVRREYCEPSVTIIIAAHNEEGVIHSTIANKLDLDYPKDKLDVLVVSDGSIDQTDSIVQQFSDCNVTLIRQEPRAGKTSALNLAITHATGDIVVFSDANSLYATDALRYLVSNFSDQGVGYVSGRMIYTDLNGVINGDGCSAYMKYENYLRRLETKLGSIVGVDGGIDAIRKKLYCPMNADQLPDFVLPLKVVEQGYRVVYESRAVLKEASLKDVADEYRMRVRVSLRALWALYDMRHLLTLRINALFSWQLWSHKVLRYLCFVFLFSAYISNALLLNNGPFYAAFFLIQTFVYIAALLAGSLERKGIDFKLITMARYFALLNLAAAHAFGKFLLRKKQITWTPRKG